MSPTPYIMEKDRVLVIPGWYPSSLEPHNGDFVQEQVAILRRAGLKIDMIYSDLNIAYLKKGLRSRRSSVTAYASGDIDAVTSGPFWPKNQSVGLQRWIKASAVFIKEQLATYRKDDLPKVIHAHTYLGGAVAQRVSEVFDIPYIVTEHYTGWLNGTIPSYHKKIGGTALQSASVVTAVSPALSEVLSKVSQREVRTLPNLIDTSIFTPSPSRSREVFRFIGAGDLIPRKNWEACIVAFSNLVKSYPSCELIIAGDGGERSKLEKLVHDLNLEKKVSLPGHVNREGLVNLYKQSHVLLHTSHTETFGLTLAEAMSCGLPVISYAHETAEYVISNKSLGSVIADNTPEALHRQMENILSNYDNYDASTIRKSAVERFGIENYKRALASIYSEAMQARKGYK